MHMSALSSDVCSSDLWRIILFGASSDRTTQPPQIRIGDQAWPVRLVHHARARRYRLVFDVARSELRLTLPRRGNSAKALRWAAGQQAWLLAQIGRASCRERVCQDV